MAFIYNLVIVIYSFAIRLVAPFNEKASLWVKGRKGIWEKFKKIERGNKRLIWFHAASLGEFEQGRPVIEAIKQEQPDTVILLTFFSPSGYEIRKNYAMADYIFYLPADYPWNARRFVKLFRPDAAIFIKYEFWYNYLYELNKYQIPTFLISAVFRSEQPFFKSWGSLHREMLRFFTRLFVQDGESVILLNTIGIKRVEQTGDTRFDRVKQIADTARPIDKIEQFCCGQPAIVCGSTWPSDENLLMDYINQDSSHTKWILAPHEIGEGHIKTIIEKCKRKVVRYSATDSDMVGHDVLIVDCIGLLASAYQYGKIAYIGGGFGTGIHNTLEAAVFGIPVIFGPKYKKFREATALVSNGGAFPVNNGEQLKKTLDMLIKAPDIAKTAGANALKYVNSQLGATPLIKKWLK